MDIKKFKLVPISFFENVGKNGEFVKDSVDKYDDHDDENNCNNDDKQRSIRSIMEDHLKDTNFTPSNHYIADYKIGDQKNIRKNRKEIRWIWIGGVDQTHISTRQ